MTPPRTRADAAEATAPIGPVEFVLRPYRRPPRVLEVAGLVVVLVVVFLLVGAALFFVAHAPRAVGVAAGATCALVLAGLWFFRDHRAYPAGLLRLAEDGLVLDDGRRRTALGYGGLRFLLGTGLALVLKGPGRRLRVDWPRFSPHAPREIVGAALARITAHKEGAAIVERTALEQRRAQGVGSLLRWVFLASGALLLLRLLLDRAAAPR